MKKLLLSLFCGIFFLTTPVFAEEKSPIPYIIVVDKDGTSTKLDVSTLPLKITHISVDYINSFQTAEELENRASVVLRATILPERESYYFGKIDGYTKTKLHINEVYKGTVQKGSVISLREPYFYMNGDSFGEPDVLYEVHEDLYDASVVGKEYIFFLLYNKNSDMYYPVNTYYGRYPVATKTIPTEQMTAKDFNLLEGSLTDYKKIYDEVLERYDAYMTLYGAIKNAYLFTSPKLIIG